jgi:pimeloyl-ACP methyl ester carboxylesterase
MATPSAGTASRQPARRRGAAYLVCLTRLVAAGMFLLASAPAARAQNQEEEGPVVEELTLVTRDKVVLKADYYPGANNKQTVPVIMLHMYGGSRQDFAGLAARLQAEGHAVIVPDLRGHGDSTQREGSTEKLDYTMFKSADFIAMAGVGGDVEAVKSFLLERHNEGLLNIEALCVVGAEMGATVALAWSGLDWSWPVLATGKQGQDVKGLVLLSPVYNFKGLKITRAIDDPRVRSEVSVYIVVGKADTKARRDAERLYKALERYHSKPEKPEDRDLVLNLDMDTKLQGTKLLEEPTLKLEDRIVNFIRKRLVERNFPWKERRPPLGN